MDIAEFLTARYDEDEVAAKYAHAAITTVVGAGYSAAGGDWRPDVDGDVRMYLPELGPRDVDGIIAIPNSHARAVHIARWNPSRVLADIAAKRRILERHRHCGYGLGWCDSGHTSFDEPCGDAFDLASAYADHPDYDPAWADDAAH